MRHILVVDDHKANRLKLSLGVKQQEYIVETAENGQQACPVTKIAGNGYFRGLRNRASNRPDMFKAEDCHHD